MDDLTESADPDMGQRMAAIAFAQGSIAHLAPGWSLADELIADRRTEQAAMDASQHGGDDR